MEQLKNDKSIDSSRKQAELTKKLEKLEQLAKAKVNKNTQRPQADNEFPTGWVVGGVLFILLIGIAALLITKNGKKKQDI